MIDKWKSLAAALPKHWQQEIKRVRYRHQIRRGAFVSDEKEYQILDSIVSPGDWVLDVGANIGHYTVRLSELVGKSGRVIAIEPVPMTFALLAANVMNLPNQNVTLLNVAASDRNAEVGMEVPSFPTGLDNYYMAHLCDDENGLRVMCIGIDRLLVPHRLSLVKVDAEGYDLEVLKGMATLLDRDRPTLIVEDDSPAIAELLARFGYSSKRLEGAHNQIFEPSV